jgi:predicted methyltransferase
MEFDLRKAINAISDVVQNRPAPIREFDQIYMKVADMVIQAEYVARVFNNKDVVFVGDGDGIALSAAHLKAQNVINYGPKSITLLDFDERIVNSVRDSVRSFLLQHQYLEQRSVRPIDPGRLIQHRVD